jgi:hypothetical protein
MKVRYPNARRLHDALNGHDPVVEAKKINAPSHLDLVSSTSPFTALKTIVCNVRCALPTLGIETHDCAACHRSYLTGMTPSSTESTICSWRRTYVGAYIVELNVHIFHSLDLVSTCALVHRDHIMLHRQTLSLMLAPEHQEALCDPGVSHRLHLDQFGPVIRILSEIGEGSALSDADLPDDDELILAIQYVTAQGRSIHLPLPLPDLQYSNPNYEIGTQPNYGNVPDCCAGSWLKQFSLKAWIRTACADLRVSPQLVILSCARYGPIM